MAAVEIVAPRDEPRILYGDSTPFPYGLEVLDAIRAIVESGVALLGAQAAIDAAVQRSAALDEQLKGERWRLDSLLEAVRKAAAPYAAIARATDVMAATRAIIERERTEVERRREASLAETGSIVDDACGAAYQALEALLLRFVPPDSSVAWRLVADADGYDASVRLTTRFGLEAQFGVAIPDAHGWSALKRVCDLATVGVLRVPRPLKLDKLFVCEAIVEPTRVAVWMRRSPHAGTGVRIAIDGERDDYEVQLLDELGQPTGDVYELDGDERAPLAALASALLDSTLDLPLRRTLMTGAALDGNTLRSRFEPRDVATRLIRAWAPIVAEIARRSAPGELMLRRDVGGRRREALFITRDELTSRIARLPPSLRACFDPFEL